MMSHPRCVWQPRVILSLLFVVLLLTGCSEDDAESEWSLDDHLPDAPLPSCAQSLPEHSLVNESGGDTIRLSLEVDTGGCPHVTLRQRVPGEINHLNYARWTGEQWDVETIAENLRNSWDNDLALDADGTPSVAYEAEESRWLMYARRDDEGQWQTERIGEINPWGIKHALDPAGRPVIAAISSAEPLRGTGMKLLYFYHNADGWHREEVFAEDYSLDLRDGLVFDSQGRPHLAITTGARGDALYYGYRAENGEWLGERMETEQDDIGSVSLALDADDRPHLLYCGGSRIGEATHLKHLFETDSGWSSATFEGDKLWCGALRADHQGKLHAFYLNSIWTDERVYELRHATWGGQRWSVRQLGAEVRGTDQFEVDAQNGVGHVLDRVDTSPPDWPRPTRRSADYFSFALDLTQP